MQPLEFNLQIEMFVTNNDEWENKDSFWCAFNEGFFRETGSGNCYSWKDDWWHIAKVEKNRYNSYDVVRQTNKVYKTDDDALIDVELNDPTI